MFSEVFLGAVSPSLLLFPTCEQHFHFLCALSLFTKPHSKSSDFRMHTVCFECHFSSVNNTQHSKLPRITVCIMNLEHSGLQSHNSDQLIRLLKGSLVIETVQYDCRQLCSTSFLRTSFFIFIFFTIFESEMSGNALANKTSECMFIGCYKLFILEVLLLYRENQSTYFSVCCSAVNVAINSNTVQ